MDPIDGLKLPLISNCGKYEGNVFVNDIGGCNAVCKGLNTLLVINILSWRCFAVILGAFLCS